MPHKHPHAPTGARIAKSIRCGLAAGTRIMTLDGMLPVEYLTPGDRIITRSGGASVLRAIRVAKRLERPVVIRPSSLAHDRPQRDVTVAPDQTILVRGWKARALYGSETAIVPVTRLIDGTHVTQAPDPVELRSFALVFDSPQIVYAEGVEIAMTVTADNLAA